VLTEAKRLIPTEGFRRKDHHGHSHDGAYSEGNWTDDRPSDVASPAWNHEADGAERRGQEHERQEVDNLHVLCLAVSMPRTPFGHKRPADVVSNAVHVMKIATGEVEEAVTLDGRDKAAVQLGSKGGMARAKKLGARRRKEIARAGAAARWNKQKK
jgi:hypothetical protein